MRTIAVITTSRADYYILRNVLEEIRNDAGLKLQVIATGMHLSPRHGYTVTEIEKDGFQVHKKVEMLLDADSDTGSAKAISLCLNGMTDALHDLKPDIVVLLGDRYELLAPAIASLMLRIPVAHIHGGETTEGAIDDAVRHAITKIASLHFTATEEYRQRIIQMGEQPDSVITTGAPGLDSIGSMQLYSKDELERELSFSLNGTTAIVTYHPVTREKDSALAHITALCEAIKETGIHAVFTASNADPEGDTLNSYLREFAGSAPEKYVFRTNAGSRTYFSCLKHLDLMVGNSSSGIIEAPEFKMPVVNIGDRQKGRVRTENVIDVGYGSHEITEGIRKAADESFRTKLDNLKNPYRSKDGSSASRLIMEKLKSVQLTEDFLKKRFYDQKK